VTDSPDTVEEERSAAAGSDNLSQPAAGGAAPAGEAGQPGDGMPAADGDAAPVAGAPYESPEEMAARIRDLTADLQRLQAEYVNYKRRVDRDRDLVLQNAKFSILSTLLPVLDDVDRAREHGELDGGFKAVAESLERLVAGEGLAKFGASGDPFDPRLHEALMHSLSPHVATTTCDKVVQAGYQFGDRVVRPALVTVVDPDPAAHPGDPRASEDVAASAAAEPTPEQDDKS
jgi:molecular chaperone GrpE